STIDQGTVGLVEVHLQTFWKAFSVSALAVEGRIQNPDSISLAITGTPDIPAKARGYYVTAAVDLFDFLYSKPKQGSLPLFVRHSQYNLNSAMPDGVAADPSLNRTRTTIGLNYRPEENLVFKADYQLRKNKAADESDVFSMGVSLVF
ncbi:MAG: hypothetical protein KDD43_13610, partial [Bdellovibrionales bacterium]|nr:hypothetical protein [Bdellovibrionales bacterium]